MVVCALTLDYIDDWRKPFREFFRVLHAPGTLVYSAGHPANDYYKYFSDGNYFDVELVRWLWKGFGEPHWVESYRRPLSEFINPLMETSFTLDTIYEPRPVESMRETEPNHYDVLMRSPGFLCARALKR
ncbi:MAG: hypothetical protein HC828_19580 [Blastochloris sp.]|nr:hypothetical protein [Blastochloris sp.]